MQERTYHESDWATRRWDRFNEGRIVEPRSFCQFWRTVLLYATISQLLGPVRVIVRLRRFVPSINLPGPKIPEQVSKRAGLLLRLFGRGIGHGLWLLAYPFRLFFPPAGRAVLARVVTVGEPIEAFGRRHEGVLGVFFKGFALVYVLSLAGFILVVALLASWLWTLIVIGSVTAGSMALYGFFKSGAVGVLWGAAGVLWGAAVAAKHGICPPVRIVREV